MSAAATFLLLTVSITASAWPPAHDAPEAATASAAHDPGAAIASAGDDPDPSHPEAVTEADRRYQLLATRTAEPPTIDGDPSEPAWESARALTEFVQSQPSVGEPVSERTEVRLLYDESSLYIAATMYDREPRAIVATVLGRDESSGVDDHFVVTLDTFHDHRNGFLFQTNPNGARLDAQIIGEGGTSGPGGGEAFNVDWDAVWTAAGRITDSGWSVEIAIPFWSLRFDPGDMVAWGINFRRTIRRRSEDAYWAPVSRQYGATRLSQSGMLLGLERVVSPRNLQVKPFVLGDATTLPGGALDAGATGALAAHETDLHGDGGVDVKWGITPSMTLDLTLNTDFSQVEADDVQINLTRFPLFFPEKREFFLENAGLFDFGTQGFGTRVLGFHSRRIGIEAGEEVPILAGGRLSGKMGDWQLGVLTMQTRGTDALDADNYGVVRVRRDIGSRSNVGFLFTNRQAGADDYNRLFGIDGRWAIDSRTTIDYWAMKSVTPGADESEWAASVAFEWASSELRVDGSVMEIGEDFNPEVGFVNRTGLRNYDATVMWTPFPEASWVRNLGPHVSFSYLTDRDNRLLSRFLHLDWDLFLQRGDKLSIAHNRNFEHLDLPFEIVPGVVIPPGGYHFDELNLELQSDRSRPIDGSLNFTWGDFWNGSRRQLRAGLGFRLGARFSTGLSWSHNDVDLPVGDFVTNLVQARLAYDFSTRLFLDALIQYDNLTDRVTSNVRLNFIHTPGADLFIVYNERRVLEDAELVDRALIVKLTHLLRF